MSTSAYFIHFKVQCKKAPSQGGCLAAAAWPEVPGVGREVYKMGFTASHALARRLMCAVLREVPKRMTMLQKFWQDHGKSIRFCSVGKWDQMVEASLVAECKYRKQQPESFRPRTPLALCLPRIFTGMVLTLQQHRVLELDNSFLPIL